MLFAGAEHVTAKGWLARASFLQELQKLFEELPALLLWGRRIALPSLFCGDGKIGGDRAP
jgi:hypothetical protein